MTDAELVSRIHEICELAKLHIYDNNKLAVEVIEIIASATQAQSEKSASFGSRGGVGVSPR